MYIYHVPINALGAHMIHINLNMIFCTRVEPSPTKTLQTYSLHATSHKLAKTITDLSLKVATQAIYVTLVEHLILRWIQVLHSWNHAVLFFASEETHCALTIIHL